MVCLLLAWCTSTGMASAHPVQSSAGLDVRADLVSASSEFTICTATGYQGRPATYGDIVVWNDSRSTVGDIYGYDLSAGQEFTICTATDDQLWPAIHGDIVVWGADGGGGSICGGAAVLAMAMVGLAWWRRRRR